MTEKTFDTGTLMLNYMESAPVGPPVLLLHGYGTRWQSFNRIIPELAQEWQVYAVDLRGHGKSGWASSYRIQDYVPDIASFIKDCIKEPAIIFGHSYGGMIGMMLAASYPELVKGLIVGDSFLSAEAFQDYAYAHIEKSTFWRDLANTKGLENIISKLNQELIPSPNQEGLVPAYQVYGEYNRYYEFMAITYSQLDPEMLTANIERLAESIEGYQPDQLFAKIKCPVLLIQANPQLGGLMREQDLQKALGILPKAQRVRVNTGHFLYGDDKEAVLKVLIPFLQAFKES